jgi:hypothetical protein
MDADKIGGVGETPEADAAEQQATVSDDDAGLDTSYLADVSDRDANEADLIDQAIAVPVADEEGDFPR